MPDHALFSSDVISLALFCKACWPVLPFFACRVSLGGCDRNESVRHIHTARWMFPLYLVLMLLFVVPIALTGHLFMRDLGFTRHLCTQSAELSWPGCSAIIAFIGGGSAATGMIIVATIAIKAPWCQTNWCCRHFPYTQQQSDIQQLFQRTHSGAYRASHGDCGDDSGFLSVLPHGGRI